MKLTEAINEKYAQLLRYYAATGFKFPFHLFVAGMLFLSLAIVVLLTLLKLNVFISSVAFISLMSLVVGIPLTIRNQRVENIETALPDALKHMALVLKAGGTTESALEEVSNAGYGPLGDDLRIALKKMRGGQTFEDVLLEAGVNSGSLLFERTVLIILDAKRTGAALADVMFAIADDARDVLQIKRERRSRTTMHSIFLIASSGFLAPFIFGFTLTVVNYINVGMQGLTKNVAPKCFIGWSQQLCLLHQPMVLCDLYTFLITFTVIQAIIAVMALGLIREGKMLKFLLYMPFMVLLALLIFEAGKFLSLAIVGGAGFAC